MISSIPRDFLYLRHGQTDWNAEGRMQGSTDIPLNATGRAQAHAAAERLANTHVDRIIASPMARAAETARIVAESKGLTPVYDERLKERYFGAFDGMLLSEIREHHGVGDGVSIWSLDSPEAEPFDQALGRTVASLAEHLTNSSDSVLFVAHGALFTLLTEHLFGVRMQSANATPYALFNENGWTAHEI
ncbi:MAG: histidine phosphatase family protein [Pseudomonadota bacterium]